ncbi:MAG: DUF4142 domain-containing protein [Janthinobacterium lividum]
MNTTKNITTGLSRKPLQTLLLAASVSFAALVAAPVMAQNTAAPAMSHSDKSGQLAHADGKMLGDLVEGNRAEVQAGQLALEKSQNADVKKFAQMMIDDHGKAVTEIEALAQSKGTKLPDGIGAMHKTKEVALKAMSGHTFDREYAKRAGVGDHEATLKLLKKIQADGKDADLKALADKMVPVVQGHLDMAKKLVSMK